MSSCAIATVTDDRILSDLWTLDQMGITESFDMKDDDKALEQFNSTVCYKEGRYFVTWPWKPNSNLPENFEIACGRMKSLSRRLQNNHSLLKQYCDVIESQLHGRMTEIIIKEVKLKTKETLSPTPSGKYTI